jgi:hypothetical protein
MKDLWSIISKNKRLGKAENRQRYVGEKVGDSSVDLGRLPNVILIAKEIDVSVNALQELEECPRKALMLGLMPFAEVYAGIEGGCAHGFAGTID